LIKLWEKNIAPSLIRHYNDADDDNDDDEPNEKKHYREKSAYIASYQVHRNLFVYALVPMYRSYPRSYPSNVIIVAQIQKKSSCESDVYRGRVYTHFYSLSRTKK